MASWGTTWGSPALVVITILICAVFTGLAGFSHYLAFAPLAEWLGRRGAFLLMMLGAAVTLPATFLLPSSYSTVMLALPALGFFSNGIFSGFPIYLPEILPTRIRATSSGFYFNAGRVLASAGPFLAGHLVVHLGNVCARCEFYRRHGPAQHDHRAFCAGDKRPRDPVETI